ncbi:magnesium transporter CorA family protein [Rhodobacter ferrooxidans]|uniref:Mg2 transporter protein CorA family protein n=1 Tax=Rhodobacter ferrooxidans TaxID=371731 RepID=C8S0C3_9RHOB|nr:magnesium transporter CorA family protein [Rhodobacter sp. SW2]EEW25457.1 Mg2 transporter protein CorA family protein [Rhodobacter sp. SW2]
MLHAYVETAGRLQRLTLDANLASALWIDLWCPMPAQSAAVQALGVEVPSLADMEEIEISNRLYREGGIDYMTVVLPGLGEDKAQTSGPVCFILTPERLVTVRHHAPRPFETYPERADKVGMGCNTPTRLLLGLLEEIIGRQADLLEGAGRDLDSVSQAIFAPQAGPRRPQDLQAALERVGKNGELLGRVRLALLSIERAMSFFTQGLADRPDAEALRPMVKGLVRDTQALEVHVDFLSSRVQMATDATLGMINLVQSATVRIVSVVSMLFLPPTLIASAYGMNIDAIPGLHSPLGFEISLGLMVLSAAATYLYFKWRDWL